jgi:glutamine amidotransferase
MLFFSNLAARVDVHGPAVFEVTHPLADVKAALEAAITTVLRLQAALGAAAEGSSLNLCVSDGEQLLAIRFRSSATEHPPSLYYSTVAGVTLNRRFPDHPNGNLKGQAAAQDARGGLRAADQHGPHVIVASEPTTYKEDDWALIPKNQCVMVGKDMKVVVAPVDVHF